MQALKTNQRLYAFILSFAVYLFPLIGPHNFSFLGEVVWRDLWRRERERLWIAADVGVALLLQVITFLALYWLLSRPAKIRVVLLIIAVPFVATAVERAYLVDIPSRFLIENDTAQEAGKWDPECSARDVALIDVPHPEKLPVWSELLVQAPDASYKVMHIPGCELSPLAVPQGKLQPGGRVDFMTTLSYFVPDRGVIFSKQETANGTFTWNYFFNDRVTSIPGLNANSAPILSLDGQWAAWLEKESIAIERFDGNEAPLQLRLDKVELWRYILRTVDMEKGEVELTNHNQRLVIDLDGKIKISETRTLSWDAYRDDGSYQVSWKTNGYSGIHTVLKGRQINSAAITPAGDFIAVSVATALNIGRIRDSVYVLRASDGAEVFRRYLPAYTRTPVYFPTNDLFAYTGDREVVVLRIAR